MSAFGPYPATVVRVVDGDTVDVLVDLGFNVSFSTSCRVFGINAPEHGTVDGDAATAFMNKLLAVGMKVQTVSHGWDKFGGRYDGTLVGPGGIDVGAAMVVAGHAKPWDGHGKKPV